MEKYPCDSVCKDCIFKQEVDPLNSKCASYITMWCGLFNREIEVYVHKCSAFKSK